MSRWTVEFENAPFRKKMKEILRLSEILETSASMDTAVVEELLRLKKNVPILNSMLSMIDPELGNFRNQISSLNSYFETVESYLTTFATSLALSDIQTANDHLSPAFDILKSFVFIPLGETSLQSSISVYTDAINKHLTNIKNTDTIYQSVVAQEAQINEYREKLLGDNEDSIKGQITKASDAVKAMHSEIDLLWVDIFQGHDNGTSWKNDIAEAKKDILRDVDEANEKLVNLTTKIEQFEKVYVKIFGESTTDSVGKTIRSGGLNDALTSLQTDFEEQIKNAKKIEDDFMAKSESKFDSLFKKIEGLLPSATRTGLALAFSTLKDEFKPQIQIWNAVFSLSIIILIVGGFYANHSSTSPTELLKNSLAISPLLIPTIWLAMFASKRRSESRRLEQEYAHKEAVAKSFEEYKKQIDTLGEDAQELLKKLLESSIEAIAFNASTTLDKKHGDRTPYHEIAALVVKGISDKVPEIKLGDKTK